MLAEMRSGPKLDERHGYKVDLLAFWHKMWTFAPLKEADKTKGNLRVGRGHTSIGAMARALLITFACREREKTRERERERERERDGERG